MKWNFALLVSLCATTGGCGGSPPAPAVDTQPALAALPLHHGYYVSSDTPCSEASNATLMLVSATGINSSRTFCDYAAITQTGPTQYRVTISCTNIDADPPQSLTALYEVPEPTRFSYAVAGSPDRAEYRHCEQARLPEPWRDNDLSN